MLPSCAQSVVLRRQKKAAGTTRAAWFCFFFSEAFLCDFRAENPKGTVFILTPPRLAHS